MGFIGKRSTQTIVYMQNGSNFNGIGINSLILSCKGHYDAIETIIKHADNFIERNKTSSPINWKDFIQKKFSEYKNPEGEFIVDRINEKCVPINAIEFNGGYIYGGKHGDKYVRKPSIKQTFFPMKVKGTHAVILNMCKFDGRHSCDIYIRKGTLAELENYQHENLKMMLNREQSKWEKTSHRKKNIILDALKQERKKLGV